MKDPEHADIIREFNDQALSCYKRLFRAAWYHTANREDAEDIVQETFRAAFQNIGSFRGYSQLYTWLYAIFRNILCKHIHRKKALADTVGQVTGDIHADMAVEKGVKLLISPAKRAYIDMKYNKDTPLGLTWASITNTKKAYDWDPLTEVEGLAESAIVGVEAPLWSETLVTMSDVEFMAIPRLIGIAEIGWSKTEGRGWNEYRERLATHGNRLAAKEVNFYRDPVVPWE